MTTIEQKQAFLDSFQENLYDEVPHRVFADWLEDNDMPEEADFHRTWTTQKRGEAEAFFQTLANKCEESVENLLRLSARYLETGKQLSVDFDNVEADKWNRDLWYYYEIMTNTLVPKKELCDFVLSRSSNSDDYWDYEDHCAC